MVAIIQNPTVENKIWFIFTVHACPNEFRKVVIMPSEVMKMVREIVDAMCLFIFLFSIICLNVMNIIIVDTKGMAHSNVYFSKSSIPVNAPCQ